MKNSKYISIDRVFVKLQRDYDLSNLSESDVVEWAGEALEHMSVYNLYEEAVAFIEVSNHQCLLPSGFHALIQIALNNCALIVPSDIIEETTEEESSEKYPVLIDCNGKPLTDVELAYYRPYFNYQASYFDWTNTRRYSTCFSPVRLSSNNFFNTIVCKENNYENIYSSSESEYTIIQGEIIRTSFKEGQIAVSYLKQVTDKETGYPLIPDDISIVEGITQYIIMKISTKEFFNNKENAVNKMQKAEAQWNKYCAQAKSKMFMPSSIDEYENLAQGRNYLIPRTRSYYGFFGRLNKAELRGFLDPRNAQTYNRYYG